MARYDVMAHTYRIILWTPGYAFPRSKQGSFLISVKKLSKITHDGSQPGQDQCENNFNIKIITNCPLPRSFLQPMCVDSTRQWYCSPRSICGQLHVFLVTHSPPNETGVLRHKSKDNTPKHYGENFNWPSFLISEWTSVICREVLSLMSISAVTTV